MKFSSEDELRTAVGTHLGFSPWLHIDQDRVNSFADLTLDHQWIHVDPERSAAASPYGGTVAHGLLTLSLIPYLTEDLLEVVNIDMGLNYGFNRVRFPAALPAGRSIRAGAVLTTVADVPAGLLTTVEVTVEAEGLERPVVAAEWLLLLKFSK